MYDEPLTSFSLLRLVGWGLGRSMRVLCVCVCVCVCVFVCVCGRGEKSDVECGKKGVLTSHTHTQHTRNGAER